MNINPATGSNAFDRSRLIATFIEAAAANDEDQLLTILANLHDSERDDFLTGLAGMVFTAFQTNPAIGFDRFIEVYRRSIDQAEQKLQEDGDQH